jgi:ABC-type multidrug transport system fused ATPase/permease subunit
MLKNGMLANTRYMLRNWFDWSKKSMLLCIIRIPVCIAVPAITALVPKVMIDALDAKMDPMRLIGTIGLMCALVASVSWLDPFLEAKTTAAAKAIQANYRILAFRKLLRTDYVNLESYEGRRKFEHGCAFASMGEGGNDAWVFCYSSVSLLTNFFGIFAYLVLLSKLNPLLILLIFATCVLQYLLTDWLAKREVEQSEKASHIQMRFRYFYRAATDPKCGKDIRLYGAQDWFLHLIAQAMAVHTKLLRKLMHQTMRVSATQSLLALVREAVAYAFLIVSVLSGRITISDFIFLFGIVTGFSGWILGLSSQYVQIKKIAMQCQKFRDFLDMPDSPSLETGKAFDNVEEICFQNVRFSYDKESEPVLRDINLTVRQGERIAIVGENGAGKTTLIKLLCGLYAPTAGQILINQQDITALSLKERFRLFGVIFQDYHFLPMSVAENISLQKLGEEDSEQLDTALREADMLEKVLQLPYGYESKLIKQVYKDAVDFSGGETQRLLLARALYKDAPVLILDEPTAALDPIAESKIYNRYDRLMKGKISFFISHRLASTQFCDRIVYLANGIIEEEGTHEDLMAKRGNYWRMFQAQGQYYREAGAKA